MLTRNALQLQNATRGSFNFPVAINSAKMSSDPKKFAGVRSSYLPRLFVKTYVAIEVDFFV